MKKALYYMFLLSMMTINIACSGSSDDEETEESQGLIYGVISDFATGEPVPYANVQLRPSGETVLSGLDGQYEFQNLPKGKYSIIVSKAEYTELIDDYIISVNGKKVRRDVQIKKLPAFLDVLDSQLKLITSIDFGWYSDSMQFMIFNGGPVSIDCQISYTCSWVSRVRPANVKIDAGSTQSIIVEIDRSRLSDGINIDYIHISSNNGNKQLKITASK